jgi:VCBS repeat-containing protein
MLHDPLGGAHRVAATVARDSAGQPPTALDDSYCTAVNTALAVDSLGGVLANDFDAEDDPFTAVLQQGPSHGQLTVPLQDDGSFTYTPDTDFTGTDSFTYVARDQDGDSNVATVTIDVEAGPTVHGNDLTVPLDSTLDEFGNQIVTLQAYQAADGTVFGPTFGIFDTGASVVTFSADDLASFDNPIPVKVVGGAVAQGIGGSITGDVSEPGTILAGGIHVLSFSFDSEGFDFSANFGTDSAATPGVQAFLGTGDGSPDLPTITGTPILNPQDSQSPGLAARIDMQGGQLDFSDVVPGLVLPMPDLQFVTPGTALAAGAGTTDPVQIAVTPLGDDNHADPGNDPTSSPNAMQTDVSLVQGGQTLTGQKFLFDTGAQLSIISTAEATALGLDLNNPAFTLTVQGVSDPVDVNGFVIDKLVVPRADGGTVTFTDVPVFVLDVDPSLDGILGMNLFNNANTLLYDPLNPGGPSLSATFNTAPECTSGFSDSVLPVLASLGVPFTGALDGHGLPDFHVLDPTTTALHSGTSPAGGGQSVTFTAVVTAQTPGSGTPTGKVDFKDGATVLGAGALAVDAQTGLDVATWTMPAEGLDGHSVMAVYDGDQQFATSSSAAVKQAFTATVLAVAPKKSVFGQPVTLTATVSAVALGAPRPGGTVTFWEGGKSLGTAPLAANGVDQATLVTRALGMGGDAITAVYGDTTFTPSTSAPVTEVVSEAATKTALSSSARRAVFGQELTFTATVRVVSPGSGPPTGTVTFKDGGNVLGTGTLQMVDGTTAQATFTASALKVGRHRITASYATDGNFKGGNSAPVVERVGKAHSTTTASGTPNPAQAGDTVTFAAIVTVNSPGSGTPTGTVTFKEGNKLLGTGTLQVVNNVDQATFNTSALGVGTHQIVAVYSGDGSFTKSTSPPSPLTVNAKTAAARRPGHRSPFNAGLDAMFALLAAGNGKAGFFG